jgi:simple sugar transport system substrate-binding protein/basic membrane protein A
MKKNYLSNAWLSARRLAVGAAMVSLGCLAVVVPVRSLGQDKAAVLLPGSINDQSWNAQGYEGVKKLKSMGCDVDYSENVHAADMAQSI